MPEMYKRSEFTIRMQEDIKQEDRDIAIEHVEYFEPYHYWSPDFE